MKVERLNPQCIPCLLDKHLKSIPANFSKQEKLNYMQGILKIIGDADIYTSAPAIVERINQFKEGFGVVSDFSEAKSYFNKLMLSLESEIEMKIENSGDPLKTAVQYAMAGNYIDFGAMESVAEARLKEMLNGACGIPINQKEYELFKTEVLNSERMVYLADNCGEIVLDKLLIKQILKFNKGINITVIVRGRPVLNDCVTADALEVGLDRLVPVVSNGTAIAGTCLDSISSEAKELIDKADIIISKGQGNFETLHNSSKNIYYLFLCKCKLFAERFGVNVFTGMFINDKRIDAFKQT